MACHDRGRSRGTFSVLSIDTIRSFSRAGHRRVSVSDDLIRSPSSLSRCGPKDQLPASLEAQPSEVTLLNNMPSVRPRNRPRSWLPTRQFSRLHNRTMSARLPKDTSTATVASSVISAPVLTSTTNVKVADMEGVHCDELTEERFDKSTWSNKVGWVSDIDESAADEARMLAEKIEAEESSQDKPGRLVRLGAAVKGILRGKRNEKFTQLEDESLSVGRRHAETINLYKSKIRNLTGSGQIRRKSVQVTAGNKHGDEDMMQAQSGPSAALPSAEQPLLTSKKSQDFLSITSDLDDGGTKFGSLTRSFNSALDKLNFADMPGRSEADWKKYYAYGPTKAKPHENPFGAIGEPVPGRTPTYDVGDYPSRAENGKLIGPIAEYIPGRPPAYGPHGYLTRKDNTGAFGSVRLPYDHIPAGELPSTKIFDPEAEAYVPAALRNHTNTTAFVSAPEKSAEDRRRESKAEVESFLANKGPMPHLDIIRAYWTDKSPPRRER